MSKEWTVGIVNYKSSVYLEYQMKLLYKLNDYKKFDVIIVDNSIPHEVSQLDKLYKKYKKFNNVKIIYFDSSTDPIMRGSGQHAEAINLIVKQVKSKYLLVHDPDFFFVRNRYLDILERELNKGCVAVGAPYRYEYETGEIGKSDFPSAFGCAYNYQYIKDIDFMPSFSVEKFSEQNVSCWIYPTGSDVGWRARNKLSNNNYKTFSQEFCNKLRFFGKYSYSTDPYVYFHNGNKIAYHLFRGTFIDSATQYKNSRTDQKTPNSWNKKRIILSKFFFYEGMSSKHKYYNVISLLFFLYFKLRFRILKILRLKRFI